jgi:hypothetical protein
MKLVIKITTILLLSVAFLNASSPSPEQLQQALDNARAAWGLSTPDKITIRVDPISNCSGIAGDPISWSHSISQWVDRTGEGIEKIVVSREWIIQINPNCDWGEGLMGWSLNKAMAHEYGHILLGQSCFVDRSEDGEKWHNENKHSVMYRLIYRGSNQTIQPEDRERARKALSERLTDSGGNVDGVQ